jgi:hypothetical protein
MALIYDRKLTNFTPLIRRTPISGGTFITGTSAGEDLSFTLGQVQTKKFRFSKFAVLRIPPLLDRPQENTMRLQGISGAYEIVRESFSNDMNKIFTESFQNYCLNLETGLLSQNSYDVIDDRTVFERVFWKWLKETGSMRFDFFDTTNDGNGELLFREEYDEDDVYNRVVKYIGEVAWSGNQQNKYATYSEVYITIPEITGTTPNVLFKQVHDGNYGYNTEYNGQLRNSNDSYSTEYIYGRNWDTVHPDNLDLRAWYDNDDNFATFPLTPSEYNDAHNGLYVFSLKPEEQWNPNIDNNIFVIENEQGDAWEGNWFINKWWFTRGNQTTDNLTELYTNSYFIDPEITDPIDLRNEQLAIFYGPLSTLEVEGGIGGKVAFSTENSLRFKRSNLDGITIHWDINDYEFDDWEDRQDGYPKRTWIDLANQDESKDYEFNAILLYYQIYQNKMENGFEVVDEDTVTENLFGILFLDDVKPYSDSGGMITPFHKVKSKERIDGETGNEYAFKLQFKIDQNTGLYTVQYIPVIAQNNTIGIGIFNELMDKQVQSMNIFSKLNWDIIELSNQAQMIRKYQDEYGLVSGASILERLARLEEAMPSLKTNTLLQEVNRLITLNLENQEKITELEKRIEDLENNLTE